MISILTSVHNQLDMNKLFYETLKKNTSLPFELIVIDNNSTDGSREFFKEKPDILITND
ncbi:MAG: glycosyltransferase [Ginsengibacter sp.]